MKRRILLLISLLLSVFIARTQPVPTGALTIFSEDGDKFFLVLNGERQNNVAQTNLRVEDLPQPYYNAKIIFEDKGLSEISKNYLPVTDANGTFSDVTYKIRKDKNGKPILRYFSMTPIQQGYVAPTNVYVSHYGAPPPGGVVTQQTTTTTTVVPNNNVDVNVNGIHMDVTVNNPYNQTVQTTTTRTTTTTTRDNTVVVPAQPVGCVGAYPMSAGDFSSALATVKNQSFDETRLSTAKQIAGSNCLNCNQIAEICKEFGFEQTKLDFAKYAYNFCTEPRNYFKINNVFGFSSSVDDLNTYIQGHH